MDMSGTEKRKGRSGNQGSPSSGKTEKQQSRWHLWPYFQTIPGIIYYQIVSGLILALALNGIRTLSGILMSSAGHEAVTTGDFAFLFTTWQGGLLILLAIALLCLYTIFDLNVKIIYSRSVLCREKARTGTILKDAVRSFRKLTGFRGILLILYMAIAVPLVGIGVTTSLTKDLKIPNFITSVIYATPLYLIPYSVFNAFMLFQGLRFLFTFHAVVLDNMPVRNAAAHAKKLMKEHWKQFIPHYLLFIVIVGSSAAAAIGFCLLVPDLIVNLASENAASSKFFSVFMALLNTALFIYLYQVITPLMILELTRYYRMYTDGTTIYVPAAPRSRHVGRVIRIGAIIAAVAILSIGMTAYYDELFPLESTVGIVAHRTGGTLAPENTAEGIERSADYGVIGCETDVQRTKDGQYIINHDDDFKRLYGVSKKSSEMTMDDIRKLRTASGYPVPTLAKLLETAKKKKVRLYIELKGPTADNKMVDDVVKMVRDKNMTDQVALISLKYKVLDYAERTYPEFETGYLYFMSFGDTTKLNVDDLIIEEQLATGANILALQRGGKKVLVWTVNEDDYLKKILAGNADGIITDRVKRACEIKEQMKHRNYRERAEDKLDAWLL